MISDLLDMLGGIKDSMLNGVRTIARDDVEVEGGTLTVSTVDTYDLGLETAIVDGKAHPVERYETRELALAGHKKWVEFVKSGKRDITKLGYRDSVKPTQVTLVPMNPSAS